MTRQPLRFIDTNSFIDSCRIHSREEPIICGYEKSGILLHRAR
jgi:hypothetical protein